MLVIGSRNSSNSVRLVEVAHDCGTEAYLIDHAGEIREEWLTGKRVVGISSGASAPDDLVQDLLSFFRARGVQDISEVHVVREDVRFDAAEADPRGRRGRVLSLVDTPSPRDGSVRNDLRKIELQPRRPVLRITAPGALRGMRSTALN